MYTFVFVANTAPEVPDAVLRSCAQITRQQMPNLGIELTEGHTLLQECRSGWFWLKPACAGDHSLISEVVEERCAVLAFGDVLGSRPHHTARLVFDAWTAGGPAQVQDLDGSFSAVIVDRTDGRVVVIGDLTGRRLPRYYTDGQRLVVSPHEVALLATGYCPLRYDYESASSITVFGWSLRGKSLLKGVGSCHPEEYVRWSGGRLECVPMSVVLDPEKRIAREDTEAISRHLDHMIETARAKTKRYIADEPEIMVDLTAGLDSRTVFSLLVSVTDASHLEAITIGEANSLDVRTARRLAKRYGAHFTSIDRVSSTAEAFVSNSDLFAFFMNGDTSSKQAIDLIPVFECKPKPHLWGGYGEIYRGSSRSLLRYPPRTSSSYPPLTVAEVLPFLRQRMKWRWEHRLPLQSPELAKAVAARLDATLDTYAAFSADGYDLCDLLYLYERAAVWGASRARCTWDHHGQYWSPFLSPHMIQMAYKMPPPIGKHAAFHEEALRRFAPGAYWMHVNGDTLLPLKRWERRVPLLRPVSRLHHGVYHRAYSALMRRRTSKKDIEEFRADMLAGPLAETTREILLCEGSFAQEVLGRKGTELLLKKHVSRTLSHSEDTLGVLVTMERWRTMVQEASREASRENGRVHEVL